MDKTADLELDQLKTALSYLAGLLSEGSLLAQYDRETRHMLAETLDLLLLKVADLPPQLPRHLVQATAVRALVAAQDQLAESERSPQAGHPQNRMRQAEIAADLQGHQLGEWQQITQGDLEFGAKCKYCEGFVYVNQDTTYNLLLETCSRL
jgi:hypothetical protein